ncbi:MAG: DUF2922 domain-containing protein [Defluviitaleaceae bacterium]|nr:DUF2922 domain-containing protein [Defluviitaleaceae bacterium]
MIRETGELTFSTSLGGTRVIRIPDPMAVVPANILELAENGILMANPFDESIGNLVALTRAERVVVNRTPLI